MEYIVHLLMLLLLPHPPLHPGLDACVYQLGLNIKLLQLN